MTQETLMNIEKRIIEISGVPKSIMGSTMETMRNIEWTSPVRFEETVKASKKCLSEASSKVMDMIIHRKPKRLPRKLKKMFKKGDVNVIHKLSKKYTMYTLKNVRLVGTSSPVLDNQFFDAMSFSFDIKYDYCIEDENSPT